MDHMGHGSMHDPPAFYRNHVGLVKATFVVVDNLV